LFCGGFFGGGVVGRYYTGKSRYLFLVVSDRVLPSWSDTVA